jgi:hypothetical protein
LLYQKPEVVLFQGEPKIKKSRRKFLTVTASGEITVDNNSDDATKPTVSEFTTVNYIQ